MSDPKYNLPKEFAAELMNPALRTFAPAPGVLMVVPRNLVALWFMIGSFYKQGSIIDNNGNPLGDIAREDAFTLWITHSKGAPEYAIDNASARAMYRAMPKLDEVMILQFYTAIKAIGGHFEPEPEGGDHG